MVPLENVPRSSCCSRFSALISSDPVKRLVIGIVTKTLVPGAVAVTISTGCALPVAAAVGAVVLGYPIAVAAMGGAIIAGCTMPAVAATGGGAWVVTKAAKKWAFGGNSLRPAIFLTHEYLSGHLQIEGGTMDLVLPPVLASLKVLKGPNYKKAIACLENMKLYVDDFNYTGFGNEGLIDYQQKMLQSLRPGDVTALPCSWFALTRGIAHIMVCEVECLVDGKFRVSIYNGGDGVEHHEKSNDLQAAYVIEDVELKNLLQLIPQLVKLHAFSSGNNSEKLYTKLLPLLKGKRVNHSPADSALWTGPQTGNSCSGYSIHLFLKAILSKEEYREFEKQFCRDSICALKAGLTSTFCVWEHSRAHEVTLQALEGKLLLLETEDTAQSARKVVFSHDPSLPKSTRFGEIALRSQQIFWNYIFYQNCIDMESHIRGAYLVSALDAKERDLTKLKAMTEDVDRTSRTRAMIKAGEIGDNELFTFLFHSGEICESYHDEVLLHAVRLDNKEIAESIALSLDKFKDLLVKVAKKRDHVSLKKLFKFFSTKDPEWADAIFMEALQTNDHELIKTIFDEFLNERSL